MTCLVQSSNGSDNSRGCQDGKKLWQRPLVRQAFVALGPIGLILCGGLSLGTATVMIPQIKANDSSIKLDANMESWLYSVHGLGSIAAVLTIPYVSQVKGHKFAFKIICLPMIIACILQFFATNGVQLLVAAILQGFTLGANVTQSVVLVAELADPEYRGLFIVLKSASLFWGVWVANAIGTFSTWRYIPLICIWPAVFAFATCFTWPESPYWLANKGMTEECKKSFRWLRGQGQNAEKELALLTTKKPPPLKFQSVFSFVKRTIVLRQFYMPMILNITMFFLNQSCAKYVSQVYVLVIIKEITKDNATAYTGMLIIDGVTVFGMYLGSYVAMKVPRRVMFLSTSASTVFFLYLLSLYLLLVEFKVICENNIASLVLLILYSSSVSWGPMLLCVSIFPEITPVRFKPFISSVGTCVMFLLQTLFLKLGPWLFKSVGFGGTFAVYGTLSVFPVLILMKYLPETSGRTIEEIERFYIKDIDDSISQQEGEEMLSSNENKTDEKWMRCYHKFSDKRSC